MKFFMFLCCSCISLFANAPILVGIAGGSGSGKTTLALKLHEAFSGSSLISQDAYYKDFSHLPLEERKKLNFDHPNALDFALLKEHLIALKNGNGIDQPVYNFCTHSPERFSTPVDPSQVILVEGILLFAVPEIRDLFDIKIFVDTDDDVRLLRRIERDMTERGRDFIDIKTQYLETVKPMYEAFVFPSKKYADVIIPEGGYNQVSIDLVLARLHQAQ